MSASKNNRVQAIIKNGKETMPDYMTHQRVLWIRSLFDYCDADGEGSLDSDELKNIMGVIAKDDGVNAMALLEKEKKKIKIWH